MRRELVQVSLPGSTGNTKTCFADVRGGTVGDLIRTVLDEDGDDVIQELACSLDSPDQLVQRDPASWGLQKVILSNPNRSWTDEELLELDDVTSVLELSTPLSNILPSKDGDDETAGKDGAASRPGLPSRNFSDFTLTAHLQVPLIRLVYLRYRLDITFAHVPEIPEQFKLAWYVGGQTTSAEAIASILDELGIRKIVTQGSKSARVEYTLSVEQEVLAPNTSVIGHLFTRPNGLSGSSNDVTLSISEAWFARIGTVAKSFSRALQRPPLGTVTARKRATSPDAYATGTTASAWRPASIFNSLWQSPHSHGAPGDSPAITSKGEEADNLDAEEEEDEGTLKGLEQAVAAASSARPSKQPPPSRGNTRLSSLFDAWSAEKPAEQASAAPATLRSRMVSEPTALDELRRASTVLSGLHETEATLNDAQDLEGQFEILMDQLGIKEAQRVAMRQMDAQRKRFLISQQQFGPSAAPAAQALKPHHSGPEARGPKARDSIASNSSSPLQALSGLKRFSLWSTGSIQDETGNHSKSGSPEIPGSPTLSDAASIHSLASVESSVQITPAPLLQTATGWSSWFSAGSPAKPSAHTAAHATDKAKDTPAYYVAQLQDAKLAQRFGETFDSLACATFLGDGGLVALEKVLKRYTSKRIAPSTRDEISEMDETVQMEVIKCLRVVLNTEAGFDEVLPQRGLIRHMTLSLHTSSNKLRALAADVLATVCVVSAATGYRAVLDAFSDFKAAYGEEDRFEYLIRSMAVEGESDQQLLSEDHDEVSDASLWEYKAAGMALVNALANSSEALEERMLLRDELARRGLNEVMTTLRYMNPPDALATQLAVYLEEKQEDQEDYRERRLAEADSQLDPELMQLLGQDAALGPSLLQHIAFIQSLKSAQDAPSPMLVYQAFVEQLATRILDNSDWQDCLHRFLKASEGAIGNYALVSSRKESESCTVPSTFLDELVSLREQVESLSNERDVLAGQISEKTAMTNTLRSLAPVAVERPDEQGNEGRGGVIQRLVAKEKEVLQLQKEVAALQLSKGRGEDPETAKRERAERNRQWANLMEEIAKNKTQLADLQAQIETRDKEVKYLKRALESVYTRFQAHLDEPQAIPERPAPAVDAEIIATRAIEALSQRDEQIRLLSAELANLRSAAASRAETSPQPSIERLRQAIDRDVRPAPTSTSGAGIVQGLPPRPPPPAPPPPPLLPSLSALPPPPAPPPPPRSSNTSPGTATSQQLAGFTAKIRIGRPAPLPPAQATQSSEQSVGTSAVSSAFKIGHKQKEPQPPAPPGPPPPPPPPGPPILTVVGVNTTPPPPPPSFGALPRPIVKVTPVSGPKLKPFFWTKIPAATATGTLWAEISAEDELDLTDLERAFAAVEKKETVNVAKASGTSQNVNLLPLQRSQNIAIMLARMRMSHAAIKDAILTLDDRKMTVDRLKPLRAQVPTGDEMSALRKYTGDPATLSPADQFMHLIMSIPRLDTRLTCMITRRRFEMDLEEIRPDLSILRNAADELRQSRNFRKVLAIVRAVGNRLNGSSFRGNAQGFQLEALTKLRDTRATAVQGSATTSTLLHHIVRLIGKEDHALVNFLSDSPHVHAATRVSAAALGTSVTSLNASTAMVKQEVEVLKPAFSATSTDRFVPVMEAFLGECEPAMAALNAMHRSLEQDLDSLLRYFGEDPQATKAEDFFAIISQFAISVQKADEEIADAERLASKGMKGAKRLADGKRSIGRGQFDNALRDLRSGAGLRRARQEASSAFQRPRSRIMLDGARR